VDEVVASAQAAETRQRGNAIQAGDLIVADVQVLQLLQ